MSLTPVDLLISARWVVPMVPKHTVLEHHSVAIHDGLIVDILPTSKAYQNYRATKVVERGDHVLMPGLINAHTHSPMTMMRGLADDLPLKTWLEEHIWPVEGKLLGADFVRAGTELAIAEMLRGGTTCANEHYFFPDAIAETFAKYHFRARIGLMIIDFPTAFAASDDEYFEHAKEVYQTWQSHELVRPAFAPHAPYTVNDDNFARIAELNETYDIPVHMHLLETAQEADDSIEAHDATPMARLAKAGMVNNHLIAVHMTAASDADIALCAEAQASIVHCPESNLKLASGFCPVQKFLDAGVNIAIGTDGCASNNDLDMFSEMRTAALLAKAVANKADAFSATDALYAATMGGAKALQLDAEIGSIETGKAADLITVDMSGVESKPLYNVISQLVYATSRNQVNDVWIKGRHLLNYGELTHMDMPAIHAQANDWQQRVLDARNEAN